MKTKITFLFLMIIGFSSFAIAQSVDEYEIQYRAIQNLILTGQAEVLDEMLSQDGISANPCSGYDTYLFIAAQKHNQLFGQRAFYKKGMEMGKDLSTQSEINEKNISNNNKIGNVLLAHGANPDLKGPAGYSARSIAPDWEIFKNVKETYPIGKDCR